MTPCARSCHKSEQALHLAQAPIPTARSIDLTMMHINLQPRSSFRRELFCLSSVNGDETNGLHETTGYTHRGWNERESMEDLETAFYQDDVMDMESYWKPGQNMERVAERSSGPCWSGSDEIPMRSSSGSHDPNASPSRPTASHYNVPLLPQLTPNCDEASFGDCISSNQRPGQRRPSDITYLSTANLPKRLLLPDL